MKRNLDRLQRVKTWQLLIIFILACFVSATLLRLNNIGMLDRRDAVKSADEAGDAIVMQERLYDLQRYVSAHMNTDMGKGIYLEVSYKRAVQAAYNKASVGNNIYKKAQEVCAPRFTSWSLAYVQCTASELEKYPASSSLIDAVKISPNLYHYVFISPLWSPDFAGWSVVLCGLILIMILARLTGVVILKIMLSHHRKSI